MKYLYLLLIFSVVSCATPKTFSDAALNDNLLNLERKSITFKEILERNKGKKVFMQIFASYCPVSQDSFDDVLQFQKENPDFNFVFLSVDHSYYDWKRGLENIKLDGQFYYIPEKGKGVLGKFLKLKSIPRFLKVDEKGNIEVFKTSKVSDKLK